jgi:PAS domain S-box-containing protein
MKDSEERYRIISEYANDLIAMFNQKLKFEYINEKVHKKLLGYSPKDLLGKPLGKFIHPDDIRNVLKVIKDNYKLGEGSAELRFKKKDGSYLWLEVRGTTYTNKFGDRKGFTISRDITERRNLTQKLRESEEHYRLITENVNDLIGILNENFDYEYINEEIFLKVLGYSIKELIGRSALTFIHSDDIEIAANALRKGFKTGEGSAEVRFKHKNGNYDWLEVKGKTFIDIDEKKKILLISRDITARLKAAQKIQESEKILRQFIEESYDGLVLSDTEGCILEWNKGQEKIFGLNKSKVLGKPVWDVFFQFIADNKKTPLYYDQLKTMVHQALKTGDAPFLNRLNEFEIITMEKNLKIVQQLPFAINIKKGFMFGAIIRDITENKKAELTLKESEEKFRSISEQSSLGIIILHEGVIKYANEAIRKITGYTNEEIEAWTQNEFMKKIHPEDLPLVLEHLQKKLKGETTETSHYSFRIITKPNDVKWVDLHSKAISYQGNIAILATFIDITEKIRAERQLKESEEKFRLAFERAGDAIFWANPKTRKIMNCNSAAESLMEMKKEEIIGLHHTKLYDPQKANYMDQVLGKFTKNEGFFETDSEVLNKSGKIIPVHITATFYKIGEQTIVHGTFHNLTERKKVENALIESEKNYRDLYEEAPNAYFSINCERSIVKCNAAAEKLLGYSKDELLKMNINDLYSDSEDGIQKANKLFQKFLDGNAIQDEELQMRKKNGDPIWISLTMKAKFDSNGKVIESRSMVIDITERKIAENALKISEQQYREAFDRANFYKDLFAHDINNILQIINSSAELISLNLRNNEESKEIGSIANIVKRQVQRGSKLVNNVQTLSELEETEIPTDLVDVYQQLENSIESVRKSYTERGLNIKIDQLCGEIIVKANFYLEKVFENVLINAVKYNENPSVEIKIVLSSNVHDGKNYYKLEFIDNGIGVADDRKKLIFEPGKRELKGTKGMGLGLSLVKKIIDNFYGKIWVEDRIKGDYSQGSRFVILLPIKE